MTDTINRRKYKTGVQARAGRRSNRLVLNACRARCTVLLCALLCASKPCVAVAGGATAPAASARRAKCSSGETSGFQSWLRRNSSRNRGANWTLCSAGAGLFAGSAEESSEAAFQHSGIFDPGLDPFPPSRPATTELAERQGHALGIEVKPGGNRPLQPIVNTFFTGYAQAAWKPTAWRIGGLTECSAANALCRRKRRCFGTVISPPTKTKYATTGRWCCRWKHSSATALVIFGIC